MPDPKLDNLMTELHETFGSADPSSEQHQILRALRAHVEMGAEGEEASDLTPLETIEVLAERLESDHPRASAVVREALNILRNIGV